MMKIAYIVRDDGACGYYRAELPFSTVRSNTPVLTRGIRAGASEDEVIETIIHSDIIFFPRVQDARAVKRIQALKKEGKKVVVDFDDNIFSVEPLSDGYRHFGTEEMDIKDIDGNSQPLWVDGKNIDIKANRQKINQIKRGLARADMVTTTTERLARVFREYNDNVQVLPNCLDFNIWKPLPLVKREDEVRIIWAGGSSHFEDWMMVAGPVREVLDRYPQVKLVILGEKFDGTLAGISPDRFEYHPWVPTAAYPYKMAQMDADIGLIPLQKTEFNECKSNLKWLEFSALEIPTVASYVSPYKEYATEDNGVWISENDPEAWVKGMGMLIEDKILRSKVAGAANRDVRSNFDINTQYHQWIDAYKGVVNGSASSTYFN